jgi:hypothetical protein
MKNRPVNGLLEFLISVIAGLKAEEVLAAIGGKYGWGALAVAVAARYGRPAMNVLGNWVRTRQRKRHEPLKKREGYADSAGEPCGIGDSQVGNDNPSA